MLRKGKERKPKLKSLAGNFEQKLPKLLFSQEKAMQIFCFYKYFRLVYPIKLFEFLEKNCSANNFQFEKSENEMVTMYLLPCGTKWSQFTCLHMVRNGHCIYLHMVRN